MAEELTHLRKFKPGMVGLHGLFVGRRVRQDNSFGKLDRRVARLDWCAVGDVISPADHCDAGSTDAPLLSVRHCQRLPLFGKFNVPKQ